MRIITQSKSEKDVGKALDSLIEEVNKELEKVGGVISGMDCDVTVGPLEASVSICVFIDGDEPRRKYLVGVNEKGYSKENSMRRSEKKINALLAEKRGTIAGSYSRTISSLPGRVYTTLIIAANEHGIEEVTDSETRRNRLKRSIEMLGNDPSVINIAKIAEFFGVSRTMIYKDLEALGYKRS